jgi:hypothetical protein
VSFGIPEYPSERNVSMTEETARGVTAWPTRLAVIAVLVFLCVPLFVGLRRWDQRNDEAIYSYAVDRILATGDRPSPARSAGLPRGGSICS